MSRVETLASGVPFAVAKAMPSMPIWISVILLTPLAAQALASEAFIRREALATSGKRWPMPAQKSFIPPPVPVDSITGVPSAELARATRSATALANG